MRRANLACIVTVLALLLTAMALAPSQASSQGVGATIKVVKSVVSIDLQNHIELRVTIMNNGSLPTFGFEIYEYFSKDFVTNGSLTIVQPGGTGKIPISASGVATAAQMIVDPPAPDSLQPGQQMVMSYTSIAPLAGDFEIPAALVWYSYNQGPSELRSSLYSNGLLVHIPNPIEKEVFVAYPYVLSVAAFMTSITVLFWARDRLKKIRLKRELP